MRHGRPQGMCSSPGSRKDHWFMNCLCLTCSKIISRFFHESLENRFNISYSFFMNAKLETSRHIAPSRPFNLSGDASAFPYLFKPFFDLINYLLQFIMDMFKII
jgi:hypothetical protein